MVFNADVKVLMGYANKGKDYDKYAKDYYSLYEAWRQTQARDPSPILFIGEYDDPAKVDAYIMSSEGLLKIINVKTCALELIEE